MIDVPRIIEESDPRAFCREVGGKLKKFDNDALSRLIVRMGETTLVRYVAARYMDPMFSTGGEAVAYKRFGRSLEAAYQTMLVELDEARKAGK